MVSWHVIKFFLKASDTVFLIHDFNYLKKLHKNWQSPKVNFGLLTNMLAIKLSTVVKSRNGNFAKVNYVCKSFFENSKSVVLFWVNYKLWVLFQVQQILFQKICQQYRLPSAHIVRWIKYCELSKVLTKYCKIWPRFLNTNFVAIFIFMFILMWFMIFFY
jgi:hypothetical protein